MGLLRERTGEGARVEPVELFFDLVFVFAVTQLSHHLLAHLNPRGMIETLIMFMGVWWVWIYTSWSTNWLDPERVRVRLLLFALMAAALVLAMAIPKAWTERGLAFGAAYVFLQVGRTLFMLLSLRPVDRALYRTFQQIMIWFGGSGLFWIAGGLVQGEQRLLFWLVALVLEYLGPPLRYYVPGLGRSATHDWTIEGGHLAERCGLFIIIALGESIIITGATAAGLDWSATIGLAFLAAFLATVAMWWLYFNLGAERATRQIAHSGDPGRFARLVYNYFHLPIVAGIIISAAADELVLTHPEGHLDLAGAALILGGPALFLVGNLLFKRYTARRWPLSHLVGLGLLAVLAAAVPFATPLAIGSGTTAVLVLVAIWETLSLRASDNDDD